MSILAVIFGVVRALFRSRSRLAMENLALHQQLAVLRRSTKRPKLRPAERVIGSIPSPTRQAQNAGRNRRLGTCQILPKLARDGVFGKDRLLKTNPITAFSEMGIF